ncbi:hypothetical protein SPSIL_008480 [Sporomusa silvacetica DSM 10669]|uniref:Uncharacterized protein n=1 Tax=Sporomusa silvacetica DSM 10669 TaxID=1123289 RepID=A0ABZ3IGF0_9FIRM|nr:hypothetical protein [Sporomusa silvacetica]OZC13190.1 hypothetical protein SPSIL_56480 [Sporomusa silvacetica DSM 10669]
MTETKNNLQVETNLSTVPATPAPAFHEAPDIGHITTVNHEKSFDNTHDTFRTEALTFNNKYTANNLVARMLWGHEENASLNVRVSADGAPDLNNDVR